MSVTEEIKDRLDIVEVISSYVPLHKSGRNFKALCPFHSEKTPSFVVFPESQRWHCFGACGEGGDVFTFVMKHEGWDFRTALEELARRAGVELRPRTPAQIEAEKEADRQRSALEVAARYFNHLLKTAPEADSAREYVAQRGLKEETIDQFLVGYSLPGWDRTRNHLHAEGYTIEDLLEVGLLVEREQSGSTYDRFRDRLMIPIRDVKGRIIGFGARTLDPEGVPKYLNSPQTALFDKSKTLFGLAAARQSIRRNDQAVIAEGYMDVMQAHQAGFTNVIAQMGTSLTETQLRQIQRYTKHLVLALDPDAAGVQATLRGFEVARETLEQEWEPVFDPHGLVGYESRLGAEIRVLRLPSGQDPDDLIRDNPDRWPTLVEEAVPVVEFYLHLLTRDLNLEDAKAKAQVVATLLPVIQAVADPVEREDYAQKIARTLRVNARAVLSQLHSPASRQVKRGPAGLQAQAETILEPGEADLESYCLAAFLDRPGTLSEVNTALAENQLTAVRAQDFGDTGNRAIFEIWQALVDENHPTPIEALQTQLPPDLQTRVETLLGRREIEVAPDQQVRDTARTLLRLRARNLQRLGEELTLLTMEAREAGDIRAEEYFGALRTHKETLLRTQRALAKPWV